MGTHAQRIFHHPAFWKALSSLLVCILLVYLFTWHSPSELPAHLFQSSSHKSDEAQIDTPTTKFERPHAHPAPHTEGTPWTFDWERDRNNHGLTNAQCDLAFPDLYNEIERAVAHWKDKRITPDSLDLLKDNGGVRVLIVEQQLHVVATKGLDRKDFRHRIIAALQQILRAMTAVEGADDPLIDTEFTIIVDDFPELDGSTSNPLWTFARNVSNPKHDDFWLIPDFKVSFYGAPPTSSAFALQQKKSRQYDAALVDKIPKVVWRGVTWTNPTIRKPLLEAAEHKPWADVKEMSWDRPSEILPMDAFCKYRYTVNTEGRSWSARMLHLLNCDSLLFVHDFEWMAHYYHLLDTEKNCVGVSRNFSDLEEKVEYYNNHMEEAQRIADAARQTFRERYTTPAATACYWRKLIRAWSSVSFTPVTKVKGSDKPRGISFEQFIVHDNTEDYPYPPKDSKKKDPKRSESNGDLRAELELAAP